VWVHSLWSLVPGEVDKLVQYVSEGVLQSAVHQDLPGGMLLRQPSTFAELPKDDAWVHTPEAEINELAGLYVLSSREYGLPTSNGRSLVGIVSPRAVSNHVLLERVLAAVSRYTDYQAENVLSMLPVLSKDTLLNMKGMSIYEARTEREDREISVTYLSPETSGVLGEWPDDATEFTAVTINWENHLITVFSDGQVWLQGVPPEEVPSAIGAISVNLWGRTRIADGVGQ
jgi:hypothetical protein